MLPMILVQNQIRNKLSGETGRFTFRRIKYVKLASSKKEICFFCSIMVHYMGANFR
jgi:hypothetical protein